MVIGYCKGENTDGTMSLFTCANSRPGAPAGGHMPRTAGFCPNGLILLKAIVCPDVNEAIDLLHVYATGTGKWG